MDSIHTTHDAVHTAELLNDLPSPLSCVELDTRTQLRQLSFLTSTAVHQLTTACGLLLTMLYNAESGTHPEELAESNAQDLWIGDGLDAKGVPSRVID